MTEFVIPANEADFAGALETLPDRQAVFLLWPRDGKPMLARTNVLRRRLRRVIPTLGGAAERVEYQLTGSRLESQFLIRDLARQHLGPGYRDEIRLRFPPWLKLVLTNPFPRMVITRSLGLAPAIHFGPFRNRSTAVKFASGMLDLFQLRRCQPDLAPSPDDPGCIYGEMGKCLRPCQQAVGPEEYSAETQRVADFLKTGGRSLAAPAEAERERLSNAMDFEGAAMMHQRCQQIGAVLGLRDEMASELNHLNAIAVVPSIQKDAVELGWLRAGYWQGFSRIEFSMGEGKPFSLDARLREIAVSIPADAPADPPERTEQLAILARWRYSTWCDGELIMVDDWAKIPYRRLVNAVARIAHGQPAPRPSTRS